MVGKLVINRSREVIEQPAKLDLKLLRKRGNSRTYSWLLIQKMKEARRDGNLEVCAILQWCYKEYIGFQKEAEVQLKKWRSKSSFEVRIEKPDIFRVTTYETLVKGEEPSKREIRLTKEEINEVLFAIQELNDGGKISTRKIGELAYCQSFEQTLADRSLGRASQQRFNLILRTLEFFKFIDYRGGFSTVLSKPLDIQLVLK